MFYVGAIDEKLNDEGYIVPGYINFLVNLTIPVQSWRHW